MAHLLLARAALRQRPLFLPPLLSSRFRSNRSRNSHGTNDSNANALKQDTPPSTPSQSNSRSSPAPSSSSPLQAPPPSPPPSSSAPPPPISSSRAHPPSPLSSGTPPPPPPPPPLGSLSLDFVPAESESNAHTGAKSAKGSLSSIERKRRLYTRFTLGLFAVGLGLGIVHLGRPWDRDELNGKQKLEPDAGRWSRTSYRFKRLAGLFSEPQWEQLLPPPFSKEEERPYTLLLSIDDLLVTSTWDRQHGWRTAKRPGVDYFLGYLSQWFEIVIFTTQPAYTADPIIDKLDPLHAVVMYRLFRESTRYHDGKLVKDLSFLNRDLSRVVAIDTDPDHYALNPDNAIIAPKWTGDPKDKGLIGLIPFLESIGIYHPSDVRPILKAYIGKDVVKEYAKLEAETKKKQLEEWQQGRANHASGPSFLGKLFGTSNSTTSTSPDQPPLTYLEKKRQEAQRNYRLDQEYLKKNEETIKKWLKEQEEAQLKAMGSSSLFGAFTGWGKTPATEVKTGKEMEVVIKEGEKSQTQT